MRDIVFGWIVIVFGFLGAVFIGVQTGLWNGVGIAFMSAAGGYAAARGVTRRKGFREAYALGYQQGANDARQWGAPPRPEPPGQFSDIPYDPFAPGPQAPPLREVEADRNYERYLDLGGTR